MDMSYCEALSFLLLQLKVAVKLGLDIDDTIEELLNHVFAVGLECPVELFELGLCIFVYGSLT